MVTDRIFRNRIVGSPLGVLAIAAFLTSPAALADYDAVTAAKDDAALAFTVGGRVEHVAAKAGDAVKAGDVLLQLEDDEGKVIIELARIRADSDLALRSSAAELKLAEFEQRITESAFADGAAQPIEVERAKLKSKIAELSHKLAEERAREAGQQLKQAQARHAQYTLKSPINGVVEAVAVDLGESVEPLKPVIRVVSTDPLWVDVPVPSATALDLKVGSPAWVRTVLGARPRPVEGKIIYIASVGDSASDTRTVRIQVPNAENYLAAGWQVKVSFKAPATAGALEAKDGQPSNAPTQPTASAETP